MPIEKKERELAAVGISVAAGCRPCTRYHVREVKEAGASTDEIKRVVGVGIRVREQSALIMRRYALEQLGEVDGETDSDDADEEGRLTVLVSLGAAFAVNCVESLKKHLAATRRTDITEQEIAEVLELAAMIKGRAAHHVKAPVRSMLVGDSETA